VQNVSPASTALRQRISHPSIPARSARMSIMPLDRERRLMAPKPRIAPHGRLFV